MFLLVPVEDSADEGGNEEEVAAGTGGCLEDMEDEGHVDLDLALCQHLCCLNAFPGGSNLDEDSVSVNACLFVEVNYPFASSDRFIFVEAETGVNLSRDVALDPLQDFAAE